MNVKRAKQEKEQFQPKRGKKKEFQIPKPYTRYEKEKRQGTLIFFIVESLLTAFAFKIFKRKAGRHE